MGWNPATIQYVYDKTGGYCHYPRCGRKKIARINYGRPHERGAFEIDHSIPLSRGGTDHRNNLFPACISCNRSKGDMTGAEFRRMYEEPSPPASNPWADVVVAVAALAFLGWLSGDQR